MSQTPKDSGLSAEGIKEAWAEAASFDANELAQLRRTAKWTLSRKLEWLEQAHQFSMALHKDNPEIFEENRKLTHG